MFDREIFSLDKGGYVVTGGLGFLGKAHCNAIAAFGGTPIVIDIHKNGLDDLRKDIELKYEQELLFFEADITSQEEINEVANQIEQNLSIKGLINNAARNPIVTKSGLESNTRFESYSINEWDLDLKVGLTGAFVCSQVFGKKMYASEGGSIINVSSDLGLLSPKQSLYRDPNLEEDKQPVKPVSYPVVKTGLIGLTRYLATYWPRKVRCNCICPGGVLNNQSEEFLSKVSAEIPLGRLANIEEYGACIVFLLSNASSYMTGSIVPIDGGRSAW